MIELRQLIYFQTAAKELNFSNAAEKLYISRQAVARSMHLLEAEVGGRLFYSEKGTLHLTPLGEQLLIDCVPLMNSYHAFTSTVAAYHAHPKSELSIAIAHGVSQSIPDGCLLQFCADHPHITVSVNETSSRSALDQLYRDEADVALVGSLPRYLQDFDYTCIQKTGIYLLVPSSNPLSKKEALTLADLDGQPIITAGPGNDLHRYFKEECERNKISPEYVMTSTDISMIRAVTKSRNCLCFAFPREIDPSTEANGVILPLLLPESDQFCTYLAIRKDRSTKKSIRTLQNYLAKIA
jgi:DNA-binding transcriptional LysR family regulator